MHNVKCVLCGDSRAEKTKILISFTTNMNPDDSEYVSSVFDNYSSSFNIDGKQINLGLWDTAGQEDYDRLRPLTYPSTDVFLLCFSLTSIESFEAIKSKWYPEIQLHAPNVPFVIVGTHLDLRNAASPNDTSFVTSDMGQSLASELKARSYMECSHATQEGLKAVFDEAIRAVLYGENKRLSMTVSIDNSTKRFSLLPAWMYSAHNSLSTNGANSDKDKTSPKPSSAYPTPDPLEPTAPNSLGRENTNNSDEGMIVSAQESNVDTSLEDTKHTVASPPKLPSPSAPSSSVDISNLPTSPLVIQTDFSSAESLRVHEKMNKGNSADIISPKTTEATNNNAVGKGDGCGCGCVIG